MSKFTPGKWQYHQVNWPYDGWMITDSSKQEKYVALIKKGTFNREGNLCLIAAAPEMYEVIKDLMAWRLQKGFTGGQLEGKVKKLLKEIDGGEP